MHHIWIKFRPVLGTQRRVIITCIIPMTYMILSFCWSFPRFMKLVEATETASCLALGIEDLLKFSEETSLDFDSNLKSRIELYFQKHPNDWNKRSVILGWLWKVASWV